MGLHDLRVGRPIPIKFGGDLSLSIETDFANHKCTKYPRKLPATPYTN